MVSDVIVILVPTVVFVVALLAFGRYERQHHTAKESSATSPPATTNPTVKRMALVAFVAAVPAAIGLHLIIGNGSGTVWAGAAVLFGLQLPYVAVRARESGRRLF